jgi:hypothetical protein
VQHLINNKVHKRKGRPRCFRRQRWVPENNWKCFYPFNISGTQGAFIFVAFLNKSGHKVLPDESSHANGEASRYRAGMRVARHCLLARGLARKIDAPTGHSDWTQPDDTADCY